MFENDIEVLKKKAELLEKKIYEIINQMEDNVKKVSFLKKLKKCRCALDNGKTYLKLVPIVCALATLICFLGFWIYSPSLFMSTLPVMFCFPGFISGVFILWSITNYFMCKNEYKELATEENLEIENNMDSILAENVELQQKLIEISARFTNYNDLIEYLSEYNDKYSLLEAVKKEEQIDIENLFSEYLSEKIDYSKVHFNNDLPEGTYLKKLSK